jgi:hypothetical protein
MPHCDNEKFKRDIEKIIESNKEYPHPIIQINDNQAVFIEGDQLRFIKNADSNSVL